MARTRSNAPEAEVPEGDKPAIVDAATPGAPAAGAAEQEPIPEIENLRAQLQAAERREQAAREEAEQARRLAEEEARKAQAYQGQAHDAELNGVSRALEAAQANAVSLKTALQAALESADYAKAAEIQAQMATVAAREAMLADGKAALEARKSAPVAETPRFQPVAPDPVEQVARTLTPRSAAWVRAHPEACNPSTLPKLIAAAQYAQQVKGLVNDSDEFFQAIEEDLGYRQRSQPQAEGGRPAAGYRQPANRGLPPVRGTPAGSGRRVTTAADIPDDPRMAEMARVSGISLDEYKKQYLSLVQSGEMEDHYGVLH